MWLRILTWSLAMWYCGAEIKPCDYADKIYRINGNSIDFPCDATKNIFVTTERYKPCNIIPLRFQIDHQSDRALIVLPRLRSGIPITFGVFDLKKPNCYTHIKPYPCWQYQEEGNCNSFQSVVDAYIDIKNNLWVLDNGITNYLQQPIKRCSPKVVAFSLEKDKTIKIVDLSDIVKPTSRLQHIVTDYSPSGNPYVYIADAEGAIIVLDIQNSKSYRVVLPRAIAAGCGESDVLYLLLVRRSMNQNTVIFSYLCGQKVYSIKSEYLRTGRGTSAIVELGNKNKHSVLLGTDGGKNVVLRYRSESELYLWDTDQPYRECNFEQVQNSDECRLSTHVAPGGHDGLLYSLSSNIADYLNDTCGAGGASARLKFISKECDDDCF
ncbi:major royal jelly protein 5-like [Toxorhynchites rutilus septentrionalis]|uniref:major royal jelly protein 5-like n=1 Tax=Toxorhynchites rutilus septentrionalis TaxID=329112 RepID=UPI0024783C34|nr:major royal jelly protein 5-like [Toxorhynchites rutilus septentrionalis]